MYTIVTAAVAVGRKKAVILRAIEAEVILAAKGKNGE